MNADPLIEYDPSLRLDPRDEADHIATCADCGRSFAVTAGEAMFASATGLPLPTLCRWHRPTRRQQLAAVSPR